MIPKVSEVRVLDGYKLWLRFRDGKTVTVDLSDEHFINCRPRKTLGELEWSFGLHFAFCAKEKASQLKQN